MENNIDMKIETLSVSKLQKRMSSNLEKRCDVDIFYKNDKPIEDQSFFVVKEYDDTKYVLPPLSYIENGINCKYNEANIIMISAPGATGKSEMTKFLSHSLNIPVFNLGNHTAVGSDSFIGMLHSSLSLHDMVKVLSGLEDGSYNVIIDALDEGLTKAEATSPFEAFLKGIADIAKKAKGLPFLIFGRTSVLEYASLYLEEQGAKVALIQIEPFTLEKANKFIDIQVNEEKNLAPYIEVRNFILKNIEGFFDGEIDIRTQYARFIGYAPVLLSISDLLKETKNYQNLKLELKDKNLTLIINIIEWILNREQKKYFDSIKNGDGLLKKHDEAFINDFKEKAYGIDEQCARLLCTYEKEIVNLNIFDDEEFNKEYHKSLNPIWDDHPFRNKENGKIINIVFEGYVLVRMMNNPQYSDEVLYYIQNIGKGSYMLYNMLKASVEKNGYNLIDSRFVPYIIESFQSLDRGEMRGRIDITQDDHSNSKLCVEFSVENFDDKSNKDFEIQTETKDGCFIMPDIISNILVDAPDFTVKMNNNVRTEFAAPVTIMARTVEMKSKNFQFRASIERNEVSIECENFIAKSSQGIQTVSETENVRISINTNSTIYFPFVKYRHKSDFNDEEDVQLIEKYIKMRRIILHFHSRGKNMLAKYKAKIDNRIGNKEIGRDVLEALKKHGIIITEGNWYYIDKTNLDELGIGFNTLRATSINDNLRNFLSKCN